MESLPPSKSAVWIQLANSNSVDQRILVEDSNTCGGEFVIYSLLELFLRHQTKVVFIAASNSYPHYLAVMKKLGINLQSCIDKGELHYMDMFGAPFEYNAFDNLPLSLSVPNTYQANMPSKLKKTSFSLIESD